MKRPRPSGLNSLLPQTLGGALDTPERVIEYCRKHGLLTTEGAVNIEALIESDRALTLVLEDLGDKDAYLWHRSANDYVIGVNSTHPRNRQRFSMAHEYAHYQLHRNEISMTPTGEKILHRDGRSNPLEWQANRFAALMLMPDRAIEVTFPKVGNNIVEAAKKLKVSATALQFRLEEMERDRSDE